jgi:Skp family chaperone for outer membrane proteins
MIGSVEYGASALAKERFERQRGVKNTSLIFSRVPGGKKISKTLSQGREQRVQLTQTMGAAMKKSSARAARATVSGPLAGVAQW